MAMKETLHILRNPYGFSSSSIREAAYAAADTIDKLSGHKEFERNNTATIIIKVNDGAQDKTVDIVLKQIEKRFSDDLDNLQCMGCY